MNKRIIKFRVWDVLLKCFRKGCEIYDCYVDFHKQDKLDCSMNYLIFQQYTGLKDKNNKEIYEGDIIKFMGRWNENGEVLVPNYEPYEVIWFMGGLKAFRINRDKCSSIHHHNDVIGIGNTGSEIIGNIFKNPELLKNHDK